MIYYNLNDSPFSIRIDKFMFYFSSEFYMNKFKRTYKEYIRTETLKLGIKYHALIYADEMLMLNLYKSIEKRGFKVKYDGVELEKDSYIDCIINKEYSEVVKEV